MTTRILSPRDSETLERLLEDAYRERDQAQERIDMVLKLLGKPPDRNKYQKRRVRPGMSALEVLAKAGTREMRRTDLIQRLIELGAGSETTSRGGAKNPINKGINKYIRYGYLEDRRGILRLTEKGHAYYLEQTKE